MAAEIWQIVPHPFVSNKLGTYFFDLDAPLFTLEDLFVFASDNARVALIAILVIDEQSFLHNGLPPLLCVVDDLRRLVIYFVRIVNLADFAYHALVRHPPAKKANLVMRDQAIYVRLPIPIQIRSFAIFFREPPCMRGVHDTPDPE